MIVNIHINPINKTGRFINWIVKAEEWSFPPQPPKPGEIYLQREYTFEELEHRRYYLSLIAIPYSIYIECQKYKDIDLNEVGGIRKLLNTGGGNCLMVSVVRVLLEIINGELVEPELESWKPYVVGKHLTDAIQYYNMRDATKNEVDVFLNLLGYDEA